MTSLDGMFVAPDGYGRLSIWHERTPDDPAALLCMAEPREGDPARRVWDMVTAMLPRREA